MLLVAWSWCWSSRIVPTLVWGGVKLWFLFRALLMYLQRHLVWPDRLWGGVNYCRGKSAQRCLYCTSIGFPLDLTWYFYTYLPWSLSASISTLRTRQTCRQCKWSLLHPRQFPRNQSSCGPSSHLSLFLFFLLITSLSPSSPLLLSLFFFYPALSWFTPPVSLSPSPRLALSGDKSSGLVAICCLGCFLCECMRLCARTGARGAFFMRLRSDGI